jgi:3-deoxy-manno-octulosonate cytidylyltransferase (CMP-KDO synthetase)
MTSERVAIVIPARHASSRYPGKPLAMLRGASGEAKPLIQRSWEAAGRVDGVDLVCVATDDDRIRAVAEDFGATVLMTPESCRNGTERCAAALPLLRDDIGIVVNLQGDAPLTPAPFVEALIAHLQSHPEAAVATPAIRCSPALYRRLIVDQGEGRVGGTTVVTRQNGEALYFSKRVLPYVPAGAAEEDPPVWFHVGVYAYRRAALERYAALPVSPLELLEGLEQLRFLDGGVPVAVVPVEAPGGDVWELNNPQDVAPIEALLAARGID